MTVSGIIAPLVRPPVMAGALFLVAGAAIVANALLLQPRPHPAPMVSTRVKADDARAKPDELVLAIQTELRTAGYYAGMIDGVAGEQTRVAIAAFQEKAGLARTGEAAFDLLSTIRSVNRNAKAASVSPPTEGVDALAAPSAEGVDSDDRVAAVQRALQRSAYGPLTTDGVFGSRTRDAIMRFQHDHGLPVTGAISDALVVELRATGALDAE